MGINLIWNPTGIKNIFCINIFSGGTDMLQALPVAGITFAGSYHSGDYKEVYINN